MKNQVLLAMIVGLVPSLACVSVEPYHPRVLGTEHVIDRNYELGREQLAYVGEPIVKAKDYYLTRKEASNALCEDGFRVFSGYVNVDVEANQPYTIVGTRKDKNDNTLYVVHIAENKHLQVYDDGTVSNTVLNGNVAMIYDFEIDPPNSKLTPQKKEEIEAASGYTNFEIIYSGLAEDTIRMTYREYTGDDLARPSFFQDLTYSKDSPRVRFRNVQLRVLDANNEAIRYIVDEDGLQP